MIQLRLSRSKRKRSNTSAKRSLGVAIKNTQTEQNLVSRDRLFEVCLVKTVDSLKIKKTYVFTEQPN